jgi:hypothetical protein
LTICEYNSFVVHKNLLYSVPAVSWVISIIVSVPSDVTGHMETKMLYTDNLFAVFLSQILQAKARIEYET